MAVDVLILTGLADERQAVRDMLAERYNLQTDHRISEGGYPYDLYAIPRKGQPALVLALAWPGEIGELVTAACVSKLLTLQPRLLAMTGVCAGNPEEMSLEIW